MRSLSDGGPLSPSQGLQTMNSQGSGRNEA